MAFIYIDESGDLGNNTRKGEYFIVTAVKVDKDEIDIALRRIPKKIRRKELKKKMKETPELKFSNSSEKIRMAFLKAATNADMYHFLPCSKKNSKGF